MCFILFCVVMLAVLVRLIVTFFCEKCSMNKLPQLTENKLQKLHMQNSEIKLVLFYYNCFQGIFFLTAKYEPASPHDIAVMMHLNEHECTKNVVVL